MRVTMLPSFVLVTGVVLAACGSHDPACPPGITPPGITPPVVHAPPPVLRLPDDAAPRRYRASLEIDPSAASFAGHIEIDVTVKRAVDAVWLNAHELDIARAVLRRDGRDLPLVVQAQPRNFVALAGPVPGGDATLVLDYTGKQAYGRPQGMGRYVDAGDDYAVTHFEPNGARRVFPCFDEPSFKVPWQLTLTVPAGRTAFTNTAVTTREALPDGRQRFAFAPTRPLPSYLIAVAVGPYETVDKPVATAFSTFLDQPGAPQIDMKLVCESGKRPRIELAQRRLVYKNARPTSSPTGSPTGSPGWHVPVCVRAQGRHTPSCMLLDRPTGVLELGPADPDPHGFARREAPPPGLDTACPDYVIPNAGGAGYYVANLPVDLLGRTLDRGNPSRAEELALLFDLGMLTETGQIDASGLAARIVALGTSEDPYVAEIAVGALMRFARMVRAGQRDAFAALVRDALGKRAGELGWLPQPAEPVSEAQLRGRVMALVAVEGGDGPARERVLALARQWLADPASLPESSWTSILVTAVRVAPETVMPRLFDKLPAVTDRLQQRAIYNALGAAPDRANQARALALLEGTGPVAVEQLDVLRALPYDVELQAAQFAFVRDRKDELLRRIPRDYLGALRVQVCDAAPRDEVAAYLRSLAANPDIGAIAVAHDIDAMDQCISRHATQGPVLEKFLADRRHR